MKTDVPEPGAGLLTEELLARPPLTMRAAQVIPKRRKVEAFYRPNRPGKNEVSPVIWWRGILMCLLRQFLIRVGWYETGRKNALKLTIVEREFVLDTLPLALDGFRILQMSDLHLARRFPQFADKAADLLDGVEVDLCVLNGDYRWGYYGPVDHVPVQLRRILSGIKSHYGTVACVGNHDTLATAEVLEAAGIPLLFNEGVSIQVGEATLWVCGIDDPHVYGCDRLDLAVRDAPQDAFILLLAHTPERIKEAEEAGVSLYLAGHTHGGQIRLPLLGALNRNAACTREQVMGKWRHGRMQGYTTTGLGTTDLPVRYNCPAEAVLITLRCGGTAPRTGNAPA